MKKLLKKIVVLFCVTLIFITCFGCDFISLAPPADTRTDEEKALSYLTEIPLGQYELDETKDGWTFYNGAGRATKIDVFRSYGNFAIEVLEGADAGVIIVVIGYVRTDRYSNVVEHIYECERSGSNIDYFDSINGFGIFEKGKFFLDSPM